MNVGAFAVLTMLGKGREERGDARVRTCTGSASASHCSYLALTAFMLSLAGIPPMAGFVGKSWHLPAAW